MIKMDIGEKILEYEDDILKDLSNLIKIPSYLGTPKDGMPYGEDIQRALDYMLNRANDMGFKTENADGYAGHVDFGEGDEMIGVLVHLDVVPAGDGWDHEPFSGDIVNGVVRGRGADDNKGPAVAALYSLKALKDAGIKPNKKVRLIFGCGEEIGMKDMEYYFSKYPIPTMGFSPDSDYPITNREKSIIDITLKKNVVGSNTINGMVLDKFEGGRATNVVPDNCQISFGDVDIIEKGIPAHACMPENGENAIFKSIKKVCDCIDSSDEYTELEKFILFLKENINNETNGKSFGVSCSDDTSGDLTLNLGIIGKTEDMVYAKLDIRVPVECDCENVVNTITTAAAENGIELSVERLSKANNVPESHPMIGALKTAYKKITGEECATQAIGGGTYARALGGNGVAFGSGGGSNFHSANEFVPIKSLMRHAKICTQAIYELIQL